MTKFKQALLTGTIILTGIFTFGQNTELSKFENDTLFTNSGYKIYVGQELKIGTGSSQDGDFKFIRRNSTGFGTIFLMSDKNNRYNKSELSLQRNMAGHKGEVKKIVIRGNRKIGLKFEPLITFDDFAKYEIDVENAINSGELDVPEKFRPKQKNQVIEIKQQLCIADEITKLKKLKDDGILSIEEYDNQKKKLLEK